MAVDYREVRTDMLDTYAAIPAGYVVSRRLSVSAVNHGLGGLLFGAESVSPPEERSPEVASGNPEDWERSWAIAHWGVLLAEDDGVPVGGAVIAYDTARMPQLEDRKDMALLLDIRVHPDYRRQGIGAQLFQLGEAWAHGRGCRFFKAETQNTNIVACRFLVKQGCRLGSLNRFAYRHLPDDVQLIWLKYIG